jgi:DNA-binding response OmpR family regulator
MALSHVNFVRPRRVLVADEPVWCQRLVNFLSENNYLAVGKYEGQQALAAFREGFFDLVILDVELPGIDGMRLLQTIKEMNPRVPIIMTNTKNQVETAVAALKAGAENFFTKPLNHESLLKVLEQALSISVNRLGINTFVGQSRQKTYLRCPSRSELIADIVFVASQSAVSMNFARNDLDNNVKLAMVEAITNSMEHAHKWEASKLVDVIIDVNSNVFKIIVQDQGEGFDYTQTHDPTKPENIMMERGRGLFLINAIMDEVRYSKGGARVEMIKRNNPASAQKVQSHV